MEPAVLVSQGVDGIVINILVVEIYSLFIVDLKVINM
jgi:hypothetical protein